MPARETEADRLRRSRLIFERAQRDGVSMADAKTLLALDEIEARRQRLAATRACGRRPAETTAEPATAQPRFFWEQGQYE